MTVMGAQMFNGDMFDGRHMVVQAIDEDDDPYTVRVRACRVCRGVLVVEDELDAHRAGHATSVLASVTPSPSLG